MTSLKHPLPITFNSSLLTGEPGSKSRCPAPGPTAAPTPPPSIHVLLPICAVARRPLTPPLGAALVPTPSLYSSCTPSPLAFSSICPLQRGWGQVGEVCPPGAVGGGSSPTTESSSRTLQMTMDTMMAVSLPPSCSVAMVWLKFPTWICTEVGVGSCSVTGLSLRSSPN